MEQASSVKPETAVSGGGAQSLELRAGRPKTLGPAAIATKLAALGDVGARPDLGRRKRPGSPRTVRMRSWPRRSRSGTRLFGYFWGPIPWMIEAAALISLARRDWADFGVVSGLLIYNAAVGFWQDAKAASALAALRKGLALKARVLRDGKWASVDAADLVVGDMTDVTAGEIVPADLVLTGGSYLWVDQAALTGESLPVGKGGRRHRLSRAPSPSRATCRAW